MIKFASDLWTRGPKFLTLLGIDFFSLTAFAQSYNINSSIKTDFFDCII